MGWQEEMLKRQYNITLDAGGKDAQPPTAAPQQDLFGLYSDLKGKFGFNYDKEYLKNLAKQKTEEDIANTVSDMYASGRGSGAPEGQSEYWATRNMKAAERGELSGIEDRANQDKYNQFGIYQWLEGNQFRDKSFDFNKWLQQQNLQLQKDQLALQKQQWEDSQPGFWDDLFGGISALSGGIPILKEGGEVDKDKVGTVMGEFKEGSLKSGSGKKVTDKDQAVAIALSEARKHNYDDGGEINGVNLSPAEQQATGETTLALVQDGEVINSNPTGDLIGRDNLKLINDAGNMVANMAGGAKPFVPQNQNNPQGKKLLGGDQSKGLIGRLGDLVGGMFSDNKGAAAAQKFQGGGEVQPQMQMMGTEQSGMGEEAMQQRVREMQMLYDQLMQKYQWGKQQGSPDADNFLKQAEQVKQMLEQMGAPVGGGYAAGGQVLGPDDDKKKLQENYNETMKRMQEAKAQGNDTEASQYQNTINSIYEQMKKAGMMKNQNNAQEQLPKRKITIEEDKTN